MKDVAQNLMRRESTRVNALCPTYSGMFKWAADGPVCCDGQTWEGIASGDVSSACIIHLRRLDFFLFFLSDEAVKEALGPATCLQYEYKEWDFMTSLSQ